jgi:hypothetical protein
LPAPRLISPQDTDEQSNEQPDTDTDEDTTPGRSIPRPPPATFAISTRDNPDEYAEARIKNTTDPVYLDAILDKELARDNTRQKRIGWINQRRKQIGHDT